MQLFSTTIFNELLQAIDTGMTIYGYDSEYGYYSPLNSFSLLDEDGIYLSLFFGNNGTAYNLYPSDGYSESDLYTPTNIETYVIGGGR